MHGSELEETRLEQPLKSTSLRTQNRFMDILHYGDESVSVAMEEVKSQDWVEKVYKPDIKENWDSLYKRPGYDPNDL